MFRWLSNIRHFILRALGITLETQVTAIEARLDRSDAQLSSLHAKVLEMESALASIKADLGRLAETQANIISMVDNSTAAHAQAVAQNEARLSELLADLRAAGDAAYEHQIAILASIINNQHGMNGEIAEIRHWVDRAVMRRAAAR